MGRQRNGTSTDTEYQLHLGKIQNGRLETGSGTDFAPITGRNEISNANTMFFRVTDIAERRSILNDCCV
jgi:hypothetical protein